jgi:AcrR family transcriptional regulator
MSTMTSAQARIHEAALRLFAEKGTSTITVSELAAEAGIARGTVYNNVQSPDELFEEVAAELADEMHARLKSILLKLEDPAERLATGIRCFLRRAHEEPHWGRFLIRFSFSNRSLQSMWNGPPMADLVLGLSKRRYHFSPEQLPSVVGMITGSTIAAMFTMLNGYKTWQDAGAETAQLVLRSLGIPPTEAGRIATSKLPPVPNGPEPPSRRKRRVRS